MENDELDLVELRVLLDAIERRLNGGALVLLTWDATSEDGDSGARINYRGGWIPASGLLDWGHDLFHRMPADTKTGDACEGT
jgi:hypothetical protein